MHNLMLPSFFSTNQTGAPHGKTLGLTKCFASNSSNCFFSSTNSDADILYGAIDTGLVPGTRSMENSTSLFGSTSENSSGNTSGNSRTTGKSPTAARLSTVNDANTPNNCAPSSNSRFNSLVDKTPNSTSFSRNGNLTNL